MIAAAPPRPPRRLSCSTHSKLALEHGPAPRPPPPPARLPGILCEARGMANDSVIQVIRISWTLLHSHHRGQESLAPQGFSLEAGTLSLPFSTIMWPCLTTGSLGTRRLLKGRGEENQESRSAPVMGTTAAFLEAGLWALSPS